MIAQSRTRADERLSEFFEVEDFQELTLNKGLAQRIIMVAANFRKEVTSTVVWLMNFKIRIQCFKVMPLSMGENLFLNVEQIIPTKDAEEFVIGLSGKAIEEIEDAEAEQRSHRIRREFWVKVIDACGEVRPVSQYLGRDLKLAFRGNRRARYPFEVPRNKELCERES